MQSSWRQHPKQPSGRPKHHNPSHLLDTLLIEGAAAAQTSTEKMRYILALIKKQTLTSLTKPEPQQRGLRHPDEMPLCN